MPRSPRAVLPRSPRAVFLDRDGVLNEALVENGKPHPPRSSAELTILPGVRESCVRLRKLGFLRVVVTNQPDLARGTLDRSTVDEINANLSAELSLDSIWVCPHDDNDGCCCRKPLPGLLRQAAGHHGIDLASSYMVGDRWRDVEAGRAAGCRTALILHPEYDERTAAHPDARVRDLSEAVDWIANVDANI